MDLEIYEALVRRSLEFGVPSGIVARVFALPEDICRELQALVRVEQFGTSDKQEYLEWMEWEALKRTGEVIAHGSPADVAKIASTAFGRQIVAAGRRPSGKQEQTQAELMEMFNRMREGGSATPATPGKFVANPRVAVGPGTADEDEDDAEP